MPSPTSPRPPAFDGLVRFAERLATATDFPTVTNELLDGVVAATGADEGFLLAIEGGEPAVRAGRSRDGQSVDGTGVAFSDAVLRTVTESRRPTAVDAPERAAPSGAAATPGRLHRAVLCAPLVQRGEVIGALYLGAERAAAGFGEAALEGLTVFAAQASLLLLNARLVDALRRENVALKEAVAVRQYGDLIGAGAGMREVYRRIEKVAATDVSVLITGETGTGKEVAAREIHRRSPRANGPFVAVSCGAIPEDLLESELFGHVKGSFTGATANRVGRFQAASGGTLFLDEIGEMPANLQVKLLRALQDRAVTRVGDSHAEPVDIRVLAATNRVLEDEIRRGTFREDLYYRLNVVSIRLPPLRERVEDLPMIARFFLQKYGREFASRARGFSTAAIGAM
ncbi:MAG TPA: sigma-54-dependent Fis family transcriptional regulator, partial [Anaeromyxobacteraceae bacterium]|nr:sigma-54-dependent Fis family transcriptional regulator [Anaeromyxobacteraceae bacterium]